MPNFNPSLVPLLSPGTLFKKFINDESVRVRTMTPQDPVYYGSFNRPLYDLELRELMLAKSLDQFSNAAGARLIYPFIIQPKIAVGTAVIYVPTRLFWDMKVQLPDGWTNLRLASVDRISGTNDPYSGIIRFVFVGDHTVGSTTDTLALFYVDYSIASDLTYQIVDVQMPDGSTVPQFDLSGETLTGKVVFKTGDIDDPTFTTFYNSVEYSADSTDIVSRFPIVDSEPTDDLTIDNIAITYGTGLLVPSAVESSTSSSSSSSVVPGSDKVSVGSVDDVYTVDIVPSNIDHDDLSGAGINTHTQIDAHIANVSNPHGVTHTQVGSATALWNANKLQGTSISVIAPDSANKFLLFNGVWRPGRIIGNDVNIVLPDGITASNLQYAVANGLLLEKYIVIKDVKAAGIGGGTFTAGAWRTRTLNTLDVDETGDVILSSNQFTLPAGKYRFRIECPAYVPYAHKARLRNITANITIGVGSTEYADFNTFKIQSRSVIIGSATIAGSQVLEVQHICSSGYDYSTGFGISFSSAGEVEIYTVAEFWKVS